LCVADADGGVSLLEVLVDEVVSTAMAAAGLASADACMV
jgi:hypothetical protein